MNKTLNLLREASLQKEGQTVSPYYKYLIQLLGFLFFGYFLFLAVIYYKERMLSFDPAFFSFCMIQNNGFNIALGRWGNLITETLPYIGLKCGCSLKTFLILFSISPIIIQYLIFLLMTLWLNCYKAALALMLGLCLTFRLSFYFNITELCQGIALSFLLWAIITDGKSISNAKILFCLLFVIVISYFHQLTVFTVVFVLLFEFSVRERAGRKPILFLLILSGVWYLIRIFFLTNTTYEKDKIPGLHVFVEQIPNIFHLPSTTHLLEFSRYQFWPLLFVFVSAVLFAFRSKYFFAVILTLISVAGFLLVILITYYRGESVNAYENYYTVLGFFPAILFMETAGKKLKPLFILILITPVLLKCGKSIFSSHFILTERINYIDRLVRNGRRLPEKKYILYPSNVNMNIVDARWALGFETLLYSSLEHPDSAVTFYFGNGDYSRYDSLARDTNLFLGFPDALNWFDVKGLKKNYYNLISGTHYAKINTMPHSASKIISDSTIRIIPVRDTVFSNALTYVIAPVEIINNSGDTIHSISSASHEIYLSYRLYDNVGKLFPSEALKTPMETDVIDHSIAGVTIFHGLQKGKYNAEIFLSENGKEIKSKKRIVLMVK